jgi:hypothetical protein
MAESLVPLARDGSGHDEAAALEAARARPGLSARYAWALTP